MIINIVTLVHVIWCLYVIEEAFRNHYIIVIEKERPNYKLSFILRGIAAICTGIILDPQLRSIEGAIIIVYLISSFWVIFNPFLNELRKLDFWYLGEDSGFADRFFIKYPTLYKFVYVLACIVSVVSLVWLYKLN